MFEYKKHGWTPYGRKAKVIEINVRDEANQTIEQLYLKKDKEIDNNRLLKKLKRYGFDLVQKEKKPEEQIEEEKIKDIDWLKKDLEW